MNKLQIGMTVGYTSPTTRDYHGRSMSTRWVAIVIDTTWKYARIEYVAEEESFNGVYRNRIFPERRFARLPRTVPQHWRILDAQASI